MIIMMIIIIIEVIMISTSKCVVTLNSLSHECTHV